jgi:sensor histidine kinase regulating citrate/malate metabolism
MCKVDAFDMSILLSNIFDNAIEASEKEADKKIVLSISESKAFIHITMKNRSIANVLKTNPKLKTTKSDSANHGYGLQSVYEIVEKRGGSIQFFYKNSYFAVDVLIK